MFAVHGSAAIARAVSPAFRITCAAATDIGRVRRHNEDRFCAYPDVSLFVVADGMGGAAGGEIAAQMAVDLVREAILHPDVKSGLPLLVDAIQRANHRIHSASLRQPALNGMGTTVAALLACGSRAVLAHVGDSRIYRLRDKRLTQLTEDHSLFNEMVRRGRADPARPEAFSNHHTITRAVGTDVHVEVDARVVEVAPQDLFLLCSDGLSGSLAREEIERIAAEAELEEAPDRLIAAANRCGGPDNITVVLVRWEAPARPC